MNEASGTSVIGQRAAAMISLVMLAMVAGLATNGAKLAGLVTVSDALLAIAGAVVVCAYGRHLMSRIEPVHSVLTGLALVIIGGTIGTAFAEQPGASAAALAGFALSTMAIVALVGVWQPDLNSVRWLSRLWIVSAAISGLVGIHAAQAPDAERTAGLTAHPSQLAVVAVMATGPALALIVFERWHWRCVAVGCSSVYPLAILVSGSRAGIVGYATVIILVACTARCWRVVAGSGITVLFVGGLILRGDVALPELNAIARLISLDNEQVRTSLATSNSVHADNMQATLLRIAQHPVTGSGFESFFDAHNIYLQLWASAGFLGLIGFGMIVWRPLRSVLDAVKRPSAVAGSEVATLALGYAIGFAGFLVIGLVLDVFTERYIWLHVAIVAVLFSVSRAENDRISSARGHRERLSAASAHKRMSGRPKVSDATPSVTSLTWGDRTTWLTQCTPLAQQAVALKVTNKGREHESEFTDGRG